MTLTVENGCFSYDGRHTVLSDISFCASPGEIVAILGKNGSGKTTLLKCSVGLLKWSGGHSFLDGRDVLHIKKQGALEQNIIRAAGKILIRRLYRA